MQDKKMPMMGRKQSFHQLAKMLHESAPPEKRKALRDTMMKARGDGGTGRGADRYLVHVNADELAMLHFMTDGASINKFTGMMEFAYGDDDGNDDTIGNPGNENEDNDDDPDMGDWTGPKAEEEMTRARDEGRGFSNTDLAGAVASVIGAITTGGVSAAAQGVSAVLSAKSLADKFSIEGREVANLDRLTRGGMTRGTGRGGPTGRDGDDAIGRLGGDDLLGAGGNAKLADSTPPAATTLAAGTKTSRKRRGRFGSILTSSKGLMGSAAVDRPGLRSTFG